jgi:hypothetical protein
MQRKRVTVPLGFAYVITLMSFLRALYMNYTELSANSDEKKDLELVTWQKEMHKCERDMYLSLSSILAVTLLATIVFYQSKFNAYMNYRERNK